MQALAVPARVSPWTVSTTSSSASVVESPASRQLVLTVASMPLPSPASAIRMVREAWWSASPSITSCIGPSSSGLGA